MNREVQNAIRLLENSYSLQEVETAMNYLKENFPMGDIDETYGIMAHTEGMNVAIHALTQDDVFYVACKVKGVNPTKWIEDFRKRQLELMR